MQIRRGLLLASCVGLALAAGSSQGSAVSVSPVQKVIELLENMVEKGKSDKAAEEIQYATYKSWCASTQSEKRSAIESNSQKMEALQADIGKYQSDAQTLGEEVA